MKVAKKKIDKKIQGWWYILKNAFPGNTVGLMFLHC